MKIAINTYNKTDFPYIDDSMIGKPIPFMYGLVSAIRLESVNANQEETNAALPAIYRLPYFTTDIGTAYIETDDVLQLATGISVDYATGLLTITNGRETSGSSRPVKLVGCKGYQKSAHSYPKDVLEHLFKEVGNIEYLTSNFNTTQWEAELANAELQCDISFLISEKIDLWDLVYKISSSCRKIFRVYYDNSGKITAKVKDFSRVSSGLIASVDIKNAQTLSLKKGRTGVYSKIITTFNKNYYDDVELTNVDTSYEVEVRRNYRKEDELENETYLISEADAKSRSFHDATIFSKAPVMCELDLFGYKSLELYDVVTVTLQPDNLASNTRQFAGNRDCMVISTNPKIDEGMNTVTVLVIENRTPLEAQSAVMTDAFSTVERNKSTIDLIQDDLSIVKIIGELSKKSCVLFADKDGVISDFTQATGVFRVRNLSTDVTGNGPVYSMYAEVNCDASIDATTGIYTVSSMSDVNATATFQAVYLGITIIEAMTLAKSQTGATGEGLLGNYISYIFRRAPTQPSTPTGENPVDWYDAPPAGTDFIFMSKAEKTAAGALVGTWSVPAMLSGEQGPTGAAGGSVSWQGDLYFPPNAPLDSWAYHDLTLRASYVYNESGTALYPADDLYPSETLYPDGGAWFVMTQDGNNVQIQWSSDNVNYHYDYVEGDRWMRQSLDGGYFWEPGVLAVGEDGVDGVDGVDGLNGTRTASIELYLWSATVPTLFPSGASTYTWSTGGFTAPATLNGWSIVPSVSVLGSTLYAVRAKYSDMFTTLTSSITWPTSLTPEAVGAAGVNGQRTAVLEVYKWAASDPSPYPSGISTYTWATGLFTAPSTPNGWSTNPGAGTKGYKLFSVRVIYTDSDTSLTDTVSWPGGLTGYQIGYSGTDGTNGANAIVITSLPATPAGTYVGQLGEYQSRMYKWDGSSWVRIYVAPIYVGTVNTSFTTRAINTITPSRSGYLANIDDWVLMVGTTTGGWNIGKIRRWNGTAWIELTTEASYQAEYTAALNDLLQISSLVNQAGYFMNIFAGLILAQKASIDTLSTKIITLQSGGKIQSAVPSTGFELIGDTGLLNAQNVNISGAITATSGSITGDLSITTGRLIWSSGYNKVYIKGDPYPGLIAYYGLGNLDAPYNSDFYTRYGGTGITTYQWSGSSWIQDTTGNFNIEYFESIQSKTAYAETVNAHKSGSLYTNRLLLTSSWQNIGSVGEHLEIILHASGLNFGGQNAVLAGRYIANRPFGTYTLSRINIYAGDSTVLDPNIIKIDSGYVWVKTITTGSRYFATTLRIEE